jgi:enoyl-CoA hydratase
MVLQSEMDGHVATLWLEGGALGEAFWAELPVAMAQVGQDARAVVLAARGRHFAAGIDLGLLGQLQDDPMPFIERLQRAIDTVADCPVPVIAAVHGACIGAGVDLIAACDVRLAAADAVFSVRETRMAMVADLGSLQRLPRIVAAGHLAELAYTGKDIDAERARAIGLVNDVFPDPDATVAAARALAADIATNAPRAVRGTKEVLRQSYDLSVPDGLALAARTNAALLGSDDLREAVQAFFEKRPPNFTGH